MSYDINHDGDFTDAGIDLIRTLDRSADTLDRNTGWQLKDGGTVENRADCTYDSTGRLSTVADDANTFTYGYQYNQATASDPRVGSTSGSKQDFKPYSVTKSGSPTFQTLRTYEARRDALAVIENKGGTTVRSSYTYTVNSIGQRTDLTTASTLGGSLASNPGDTDWAYDSLGQVQSAAAPGSAADRYFAYDSIGNRLQSRTGTATNSGGTLTEYFGALTPSAVAGANLLNQYVGIATGGTTLQPLYDDDGNATAYPLPAYPAANSGLAWDGENRQVSVAVNGVTTTYLYDAISRRIAKVPATGSPTLYIYDGWNCIAEYTGTTLSKSRTWGLDLSGTLQGAGGVGGLLAVKQGGSYFYPTYDGNGNVSEYLAADGSTAAHFEYDPFGNTVVNTDTGNLFNYRFSTKPLDFETGLYYYGYRYYDPQTGRWPSRDPIRERGGLNLYAFITNCAIYSIDLLRAAEVTFTQSPTKVETLDVNPFSLIRGNAVFHVVKEDQKCYVQLKSIEWWGHVVVPNDTWFQQAGYTTDMTKIKAFLATIQNDPKSFYGGKFRNAETVKIHELEHIRQFESVKDAAKPLVIARFTRYEAAFATQTAAEAHLAKLNGKPSIVLDQVLKEFVDESDKVYKSIDGMDAGEHQATSVEIDYINKLE